MPPDRAASTGAPIRAPRGPAVGSVKRRSPQTADVGTSARRPAGPPGRLIGHTDTGSLEAGIHHGSRFANGWRRAVRLTQALHHRPPDVCMLFLLSIYYF